MSDAEENKSEVDESTSTLVERMDRAAKLLLDLVENENTSETQKGRLFAQCLNWAKVRPTLVPSGEGNKLKEMQNAIESKSGKRSGSSAGRSDAATKDGNAIEAIIRNLPKPAHRRGLNGDKAGAERAGGGADSDGGSIRVDGGGDDEGNEHGARHSA